MASDFSVDYTGRSDDELLLLASDRSSLTAEAAAALNAEFRRRNLKESDLNEYQRFVDRNRKREKKKLRRKIFGTQSDRRSWFYMLKGLVVIALISSTYLVLPNRYRMKPDWQEAAVLMMFAAVFIAVFSGSWARKAGFWLALVLSSAIHLIAVHTWIQRVGNLGRSEGKLAILLGLLLFLAVYGLVRVLQRNFYGNEVHDHR
jgi:membrane glycosyltransferase